MSKRFVFFAVVCLIGFLLPWWLFVPAVVFYAFRYTAYELVILGFMLDASYGTGTEAELWGMGIPACIYTLGITIVILALETVKPRLAMSS